MNLRTFLASLLAEGGTYSAGTPDNWLQGRTMYGGAVAALGAHVARLAAPDLPPLRSAQICFMTPAQGRLNFCPAILRRGRSVTVVNVDCVGEAGVTARMIFTYGQARVSQIVHDLLPQPDIVPWDVAAPFSPELKRCPPISRILSCASPTARSP